MEGQQISTMNARVEKVELVGQTPEYADALTKGLDFLKSRISVLGAGQHAEYTVIVHWDGKTTRVRKRFSEFATLHDFLKIRFPTGLTFDLPAKTAVRMFSHEALEDRKNSLNAYLKELCRQPQVIQLPQVQIFFGIMGGQPWGPQNGAENVPTLQSWIGGDVSQNGQPNGQQPNGQQPNSFQQPGSFHAPSSFSGQRQRLDNSSGNTLPTSVGSAPIPSASSSWTPQSSSTAAHASYSSSYSNSYQNSYQSSYQQPPPYNGSAAARPQAGYGAPAGIPHATPAYGAPAAAPAYGAPAAPYGSQAPLYGQNQSYGQAPQKPAALPRQDSSDDDLAGWDS
eukprot:TRINITY_DN7405_c0_g1_i1.p1 TRINITY_DN7405_c0_g1~~TRINITY_DN7405_c0_g1_i1.p1  ORF type:complete len:339 (-),score=43.72 TRINITY_DN7405_c0_g1_i1:185-1201(-)